MGTQVGIDLIEVARVERALDRHPRLADRLFTEAELAYSRSKANPGQHLAARFAAKEAVVKALRLGAGTSLKEIEVISGTESDPAPRVKLTGRALEEAGPAAEQIEISLTHLREMAGAVATVSKSEN